MTHSNILPILCDDIPCEVQLHPRTLNFILNAFKSKNPILNMCGKLVLSGSGSDTSRSFNYICNRYELNKAHVIKCNKFKIKECMRNVWERMNNINEDICMNVSMIRELIEWRHLVASRAVTPFYNLAQIDECLRVLCIT